MAEIDLLTTNNRVVPGKTKIIVHIICLQCGCWMMGRSRLFVREEFFLSSGSFIISF